MSECSPDRQAALLVSLIVVAADVTIICDGERIPAHRFLLITQSTFSRGALLVNMRVRLLSGDLSLHIHVLQEKLEGIITLPESSLVIRSLLSWLYTSTYTPPPLSSEHLEIRHDLHVHIVTDKYGIPALKRHTAQIASRYLDDIKTDYLDKTIPSSNLLEDAADFLELAWFLYENTHDKSEPLRCKMVDLALAMRAEQKTAEQEKLWTECFGQVP